MSRIAAAMNRWISFKSKARQAAIPPGRRVYAIGDIHGRADLLQRLHQLIAEDAAKRAPARNTLIYLGDYIDRGPDSRDVIKIAASDFPHGFEKQHLIGNHEALMLDFLANPSHGARWLSNGGKAVLLNFGIEPPSEYVAPERFDDTAQALSDALTPDEWAFLKGLKYSHREGHYFFVHAGVRPGVALAQQKPEDLIWIRDPFLESNENFGARVVHGHSIRREVEMRPNRIGIDTGAYATGKLTCLGLQGTGHWLIQT